MPRSVGEAAEVTVPAIQMQLDRWEQPHASLLQRMGKKLGWDLPM